MIYDSHAYLGNNPIWSDIGLNLPFDGDEWIKLLDKVRIDGVLTAPPGIGAEEDFIPDMDIISEAVKRYPDRIFGFARINPRKGAMAINELRKRVEDQGFKALKMNTLDGNYTLGDKRLLYPVIETAANLKIPVFFHTGDYSFPTCTPSMVSSIAKDFSQVNFIIGHMGFGGVNGFPGSTEELIPCMKSSQNLFTETAGVFKAEFIQDVVDSIGADRVLLGSNGPYSPNELPKIMIEKHMNKLTDAEKSLILGGNFLRVFNI